MTIDFTCLRCRRLSFAQSKPWDSLCRYCKEYNAPTVVERAAIFSNHHKLTSEAFSDLISLLEEYSHRTFSVEGAREHAVEGLAAQAEPGGHSGPQVGAQASSNPVGHPGLGSDSIHGPTGIRGI